MSSVNDNTQLTMKPFVDFYQAKDWVKALQWLDEHQHDLGPALAFYNMGVVSLKMNQLPLARYYFEYAKNAGFNDPGVYKNIEFIRNDLGLISVENRSFIENTKTKIYSVISLETITLIVLIIILSLVAYWTKFKVKKNFYVLVLVLIFTIGISVYDFFNSIQGRKIISSSEAVILQEQPIFEGPSAIFESLGKVPAGLKIKWDQKGNGWGKIAFPSEFSGWVKLDDSTIKELQ